MNAREVLAKNFKKLRDATPGLNTPKDIVKAGAATNGTIGRINKMASGPSVDTIEHLAAAYGLDAWQMLVPGLEARPSASGRPVVTGCTIGGWPFELVDQSRYEALSDIAKGAAQTRMMDEIEAQERKAQATADAVKTSNMSPTEQKLRAAMGLKPGDPYPPPDPLHGAREDKARRREASRQNTKNKLKGSHGK